MKSLLSVMVLLLSKTRLIFRWKRCDSFACKTAVSWEKNAFCLHSVMFPASCSAQFPKWTWFFLLPAHSWQGAVPAGVVWAQSSWFSFHANVCVDVQCEVAAGVCSLWCRLSPYPSDSGKECLHSHTRGVCPCAAPEQSPAATHVCPRSLSAHVSQCLTLHWNELKSYMRSSQSLCRIGNVQDRRTFLSWNSLGHLKNWETGEGKTIKSEVACQTCAMILGPWLFPVCVQC